MSQLEPLPYRVRVYRKVEEWVEVIAESPEHAEQLAGNLPNVLSVFGKSAIRGDMVKGRNEGPIGVQEEMF